MTFKKVSSMLRQGAGRLTEIAPQDYPEGVTVIDLSGCRSKQAALEKIAQALGFEDWFGMNLDALFDSLTDAEPEDPPRVLVIRGDRSLQPSTRHGLLECFADAAKELADYKIGLAVYRETP